MISEEKLTQNVDNTISIPYKSYKVVKDLIDDGTLQNIVDLALSYGENSDRKAEMENYQSAVSKDTVIHKDPDTELSFLDKFLICAGALLCVGASCYIGRCIYNRSDEQIESSADKVGSLFPTNEDVVRLLEMDGKYGSFGGDYSWLPDPRTVPKKFIDAGWSYSDYAEHCGKLSNCGSGEISSHTNCWSGSLLEQAGLGPSKEDELTAAERERLEELRGNRFGL